MKVGGEMGEIGNRMHELFFLILDWLPEPLASRLFALWLYVQYKRALKRALRNPFDIEAVYRAKLIEATARQ